MSRDPSVYANPSSLRPERFLGEKPEPDPYLLAFGFGRRWEISSMTIWNSYDLCMDAKGLSWKEDGWQFFVHNYCDAGCLI